MKRNLIKVYFENNQNDLYRDIVISDRLTLDKLAYSLIALFKAEPGYLYSFTLDDRRIVSRVDFKCCKSLDCHYELDADLPFVSLNLRKGDMLTFSYGPSLCFSFTIKLIDDNYSLNDDVLIPKIISGRGYGIIKHLATLKQYLNNKDEFLYLPSLGRKIDRKDYFKFNFYDFDILAYQKDLEEELPILIEGYSKLPERLSAY